MSCKYKKDNVGVSRGHHSTEISLDTLVAAVCDSCIICSLLSCEFIVLLVRVIASCIVTFWPALIFHWLAYFYPEPNQSLLASKSNQLLASQSQSEGQVHGECQKTGLSQLPALNIFLWKHYHCLFLNFNRFVYLVVMLLVALCFLICSASVYLISVVRVFSIGQLDVSSVCKCISSALDHCIRKPKKIMWWPNVFNLLWKLWLKRQTGARMYCM